MNLAFSGGTAQQVAWVKEALASCDYPLDSLSANVTVTWGDVTPCGAAHTYMCTTLNPDGSFTITIENWADDANNPQNGGLPNPGADIKTFYMQSFVHELGHVAHYSLVANDTIRSQIAALFWKLDINAGSGKRYGTLADYSTGQTPGLAWADSIVEAIAECIKCAFYSQRLIFMNRTNWRIDESNWGALMALVMPAAGGPFLTYEGVVFERVPDLQPDLPPLPPYWNTDPPSPVATRFHNWPGHVAPIFSPPSAVNGLPWLGPASDQSQEVQLEIRWPASVTAVHERALLVVDFTFIPEFLTEPVQLAPGAFGGNPRDGYGFDFTGGDITGYGWNWPGSFTFNPVQFPGVVPWQPADNNEVFAYMMHDHFPPLMVQPVDLSPQIHDPADGGGYLVVDGNVIWPAGAVRPTPYFYLPAWSAPSTPPPYPFAVAQGLIQPGPAAIGSLRIA